MELPVGEIVRALRKKKGMTQQQLAQAVGVSTAAVSKWESGRAYPDITLLSPIARQLETTVDGLLQFSPELSHQAMDALVEELYAAFDQSLAHGAQLCEQFLREYPGSDELKLHVGTALAWSAGQSEPDPAERRRLELRAVELCKPAASSPDLRLRRSGLQMLANLYLATGQLEQAEAAVRERVAGLHTDADLTLATILLRKGEREEARAMYQRCLFQGVTECQSALLALAGMDRRENVPRARTLYDAILGLQQLFFGERLPGFSISAHMGLGDLCAEQGDLPGALDALRGFLEDMGRFRELADLGDSPFFHSLSTGGNTLHSATGRIPDVLRETAARFRSHPVLGEDPRLLSLLRELEELADRLQTGEGEAYRETD